MLVLFLSYTFSNVLTYADYYINKDFISAVLCINKEKPQMHCNGNCYLEKQLEKSQKEQAPVNTNKKTNEIQLFSCGTFECNLADIHAEQASRKMSFYLFPLSDKHLSSIFRPPCV